MEWGLKAALGKEHPPEFLGLWSNLAITNAPNPTVVLASGDGDYAPVVGKMVDELSIVVEVYGAQDLTAGLLARRATRFVPIQGQMLLPIPTSW